MEQSQPVRAVSSVITLSAADPTGCIDRQRLEEQQMRFKRSTGKASIRKIKKDTAGN